MEAAGTVSGEHRSTRRLLDALGRIAEFEDLDSFRNGISAAVKRLVACDIASYNEIDPGRGEALAVVDPEEALLDEAVEALGLYAEQNPLIAYEQRTGNGLAVKLSDFVSRRELHRLEIYDLAYRKLETEYQLAFALPATRGRIVGLALNRSRRDFSERDREILDLLRPHAAAAYRRLSESDHVRRALRALEDASVARSGVILVDSGLIGFASEGALWLAPELGSGLMPEGLREWALSGDARSESFELRSIRGPVTARYCAGRGPGGVDAIVLTVGAGPPRRLAADLGLSARQAEVLTMVARGMSNIEIANAMSLSQRTVEKHLQRIYRRLGVSNRTEAAARTRRD